MSESAVPGYRNHILSSLPNDEIQQLASLMQPSTVVMQQVIHEVGNPIEDVYFPETGLVSVTADTKDNGLVEVGLIGREGFTGSQVLLSADAVAVHRSFIQIPGTGYRLRAATFRAAMQDMPVFRDRCMRYIHFLMIQTAQTAACNARHELPERLARWLLMSLDRSDSNLLPMKQEFLSYMLGVRRAGVSMAIGALQSAGIIQTSRGNLTIVDRQALEEEACACYQIIEQNRLKILGGVAKV